jgi:hypothetical protein
MFSIKPLPEFSAWLFSLKDGLTHRRLVTRLRKATLGNLGDVKPVGEGVFEMREHFGPGLAHVLRPARHGADRDAGRRQQIDAGRRYFQGHPVGRYRGGLNHD